MRLMVKLVAGAGLGLGALLAGLPAQAAERAALLLMQSDYDRLDDLSGAPDPEVVSAALSRVDFRIAAREDGNFSRMMAAFDAFLGNLDDDTSRVVVLLSGHFVTNGRETYLLADNAREPMGLGDLTRNGLPMSAVMAAVEDHEEEVVVVLAESGLTGEVGPRARYGIGNLDIPDGVTVALGTPAEAAAFVTRVVANPRIAFVEGAERQSMRLVGYRPGGRDSFLGVESAPAQDTRDADREADRLAWRIATEGNSVASYRRYLERYPNGLNVNEARQRIRALDADPQVIAQRAEEALNLSRDARREIQRNLSILGYNTRGIDGIFGPGTRGAIRGWQEREGLTPTSYLDARQITSIGRQADVRAAELEEEARRQREAEERRDRAFWEETGAFEDEAGYRAYLERYPDGLFSERARQALDDIEAARRARAQQQDRQRWQQAQQVGSVTAYREYLRDFPEGAFADEARRQIAAQERPPEEVAAEQRAQAAEAALGLDGGTRRLVEARLQQLNLEPGPVDGTFDQNTRRALRRYQNARGLPVTGYMDQATAVRMLTGAFFR